jgi:hypothetical protein
MTTELLISKLAEEGFGYIATENLHRIINWVKRDCATEIESLTRQLAEVASGKDEFKLSLSKSLDRWEKAITTPTPTEEITDGERLKIICLCGSSRFVGESAVKAWEFNKRGIATFFMPLLPQWYPGVQEHHQAEAENVAANLDNLWLRLIALADEIFVVNCGGYIGERTGIEIAHAKKLGKPINYLVPIDAAITARKSKGLQT